MRFLRAALPNSPPDRIKAICDDLLKNDLDLDVLTAANPMVLESALRDDSLSINMRPGERLALVAGAADISLIESGQLQSPQRRTADAMAPAGKHLEDENCGSLYHPLPGTATSGFIHPESETGRDAAIINVSAGAPTVNVVGQCFGVSHVGQVDSLCTTLPSPLQQPTPQDKVLPSQGPARPTATGSWKTFLEALDLKPVDVAQYERLFLQHDLKLITVRKTMKRGDAAVERALKDAGVVLAGHVHTIVNAIADDDWALQN